MCTMPTQRIPPSADVDANLGELLSLSRHWTQREFRSTKIRSITDEDLAHAISLGTKRAFAREGLEKILVVVLDVIAQEEGIANGSTIDRAGNVKVNFEQCTDDSGPMTLNVEEVGSSADSSPTASTAPEKFVKLDPEIWDALDTTAKRTKKHEDAYANVAVLQKFESPWSVRSTPPGRIHFSPSVPEHLLLFDTTPSISGDRQTWDDTGMDLADTGFFTRDKLGFFVPKEMLPTSDNSDGLDLLPAMPLELLVQTRLKIDADYLQGRKVIEQYGDMILYQARNFGVTSHCLGDFTIRRKRGPSTRVHSRGDVWTACDFCIETRRLCLVMLRINHHETEKVILPLPPQLRVGKQFTEMGFWVRNETETIGTEIRSET